MVQRKFPYALASTALAGAALAGIGLISGPALAMGGGGGGSTPSMSAPQYDPAEEYRKGVAALQAGDYKVARIAFGRVSAAAPRDANAQYLSGLAAKGMQDWKAAIRSFARAVKLDANHGKAWGELGAAQARLGDRKKAGETLAAIKARMGQCGTGCTGAADLTTAAAQVEAALAGAPAASRASESSLLFASSETGDTRYLQAITLINEGRHADAIAALNEARAVFGPHPDILTYLGFAHRKLGRFDEAEGYYRLALSAAPAHRGATEYFGELMVERGDLAGARRMLARLDAACRFGCAEAEELRAWITAGHSPHS